MSSRWAAAKAPTSRHWMSCEMNRGRSLALLWAGYGLILTRATPESHAALADYLETHAIRYPMTCGPASAASAFAIALLNRSGRPHSPGPVMRAMEVSASFHQPILRADLSVRPQFPICRFHSNGPSVFTRTEHARARQLRTRPLASRARVPILLVRLRTGLHGLRNRPDKNRHPHRTRLHSASGPVAATHPPASPN